MLPSYPTAKGVAGNKLQVGAPWAEGLCAGVTSHPGTAVSMEHPSLPGPTPGLPGPSLGSGGCFGNSSLARG